MISKNPKNIKVLFLSPSLEGKGGVSNYSRYLLKAFSPDVKVEHFIIGDRPGNRSILKKMLIPVCDTFNLLLILYRNSYDLVHLNPSLLKFSILRDSFYLIIALLFGYGNRTVVFFRGWDECIMQRIINSMCFRYLFILIYRKVGKILVLATKFKTQLMNAGIREEKIILTSTMYKQIDNLCRRDKKDRSEMVYILYMSRFVKNKGMSIACNVLKKIVDNGNKNIKMIFAGDGPEMGNLRSFIKMNQLSQQTIISGYVSGKQKDEILAKSDIFLFPTQYGEGLPNAILEAMGAGQAIVSSKAGGIPDVIEQGLNGFLHDSKDPEIFYTSVKRLIDDKTLRRKIQKENSLKAQKNYEVSAVTKRIENIYRTVVNFET